MLIDADGLNMLNQSDYFFREEINKGSEIIYTPHPGEAARLLDCSTREVQNDRVSAAKQLQSEYGGLVVLKGPGTLLCYEQNGRQQVDQCVHGNPGMASGGMGDVLSGVIGGLLAQRYSLSESGRLCVCIHSYAADQVASKNGQRGLLATDLLSQIQHLVSP